MFCLIDELGKDIISHLFTFLDEHQVNKLRFVYGKINNQELLMSGAHTGTLEMLKKAKRTHPDYFPWTEEISMLVSLSGN